MANSLLQVRVDNSLKDKAAEIFESLGIDISVAVRMFLKRVVIENGIPFKMTLPYEAKNGVEALITLGENAKKNGTSEITLDEINAEIDDYRKA